MSKLFKKLIRLQSVMPEETVNIDVLIKALNERRPKGCPELPLWGESVTLRGMTASERDSWDGEQLHRAEVRAKANGKPELGQSDFENFRARYVARHIIDDGERSFANDAGIAWLGSQPASVIGRLFDAAQHLSGMTSAEIEALIKKSERTPENEPGTDSQESQDAQSLN